MKSIFVFPGSFDPFTKGHEDIVHRILPFCDELIVAVGVNTQKRSLFSLESRLNHIRTLFAGTSKVSAETYTGLTTEFCKQKAARCLIRGLRSGLDAEYEKSIAQMNRSLSGLESIFLMTAPEFAAINSSIVREIAINGGDITKFVTKPDLLIIDKKG